MEGKEKILFDMMLDIQSKINVLCELQSDNIGLDELNEAIRISRINCIESLLNRFPDEEIQFSDN
jgi:hypothetical protein